MTDCTHYQNDLKAYADGELSWLRRAAVRRHLTHCASCQEEITFMTQISDDLRTTEPGDGLPSSLREKLLEPGTGKAGLLSSESASGTKESSVAERLASKSSPALPVPDKKRRPPAWVFACAVLVTWFILYPLYNRNLAEPAQERRLAAARSYGPDVSYKLLQPDALPPAASASMQSLKAPRPAPTDNFTPPALQVAAPARSSAQADTDHAVAALPDTDLDAQRQVHKEASIGLQVPNPEATGDTLNQMVQEAGGYVAANDLSTDPTGLKSGELIVKVPEPQFEAFLAAVAKLGAVMSKNITGQDITEKTSDARQAQSVEESDLTQAEARLKALGAHAKWEDTQNAEDLRVRLAQTRARLKLLQRMAALGTITIDLSQTPKAAAVPPVTNGFIGSLKATTHDALQSLVSSAGALLALVIWLLAYAPIWVPLLLLGRYALKEYRKREAV